MKRRWHYAAWLALPLVFAWLLRQTSLDDLQSILNSIQPAGLAALLAFNLLAMLLFSSRWWLSLRALGCRLPYLAIFRYRMAGFAISYLTPGTQFGGEPLQVYALHGRHQVPMPVALASVALDKLFELLSNFTFLAIGATLLLQHRLLAGLPRIWLAAWIGGLLAVPLVYLALLWGGRRPFSSLIGAFEEWATTHPAHPLAAKMHWVSHAAELSCETEGQISSLLDHRPGALLWIALSACLIWALLLSEYWLALKVLGASASPYQVVVAFTVARLAFLVPLPGGLGALEAGQVLAMEALGLGAGVGLAISLWIRLRDALLSMTGAICGAGLASAAVVLPASPAQAGD